MKYLGFFLSITFLTALSCCSGCKKNVANVDNDITFDSIQIKETYHMFNDTLKPSCNLQINFVFPANCQNKNILKSIQSIFVSKFFGDNFSEKTPQEAIEEYKNQYVEGYKQFEQEFNKNSKESESADEELGMSFSYYENSHNSIFFNENNILSFSVYFENYTGGAHGSHRLYGYAIDLNTGNLISESDIFCESCYDEIATIIAQKIARQNNVSDVKELENLGYMGLEGMSPNGNFLINKKGITYIFNEYEIAPYVMGRTEVLLPFDEINIYMNKKSPVAKLAF